MAYYLNMSLIDLDEYKVMLKTEYLIPSQMILRDGIDDNFRSLKAVGLNNMNDLYLELKTSKKVENTAKETGVDKEYLTVLRREVLSHIPKPRLLKDYPDFDDKLLNRLNDLDIKTSKDLYEHLLSLDDKSGFDEMDLMVHLMDVTRLRYVSPLFATALVKSGYKTVEEIASADVNNMYEDIISTNEELNIYKGKIGLNDIRFLIEDAKRYRFELNHLI